MNALNSKVKISDLAQPRFLVGLEMRKQFFRSCCQILLCGFGLVVVTGQNHLPQSRSNAEFDSVVGHQRFEWEVKAFGFYALKGVLASRVDLCQPQQMDELELLGEILRIESNLNELQIDHESRFKDYFERIMDNDPFNCGTCRLKITLCGKEPESLEDLYVCRAQLSGEDIIDLKMGIVKKGEDLQVKISRDEVGLNFTHLGLKGSLLNSFLGQNIIITLIQ